MPLHTTDALILRTYKLGESDRIVVFLTRDRGKKRGVAKNARQSRRRFGGALEPMTCGRVGYVERERRDWCCWSTSSRRGRRCRRSTARRSATSSYFAELIDEWAQEADPNETLFRLGASVVEAMAPGVPIEPLARYFEFWLLRLQGVYEPDARLSDEARAFLAAARGVQPAGARPTCRCRAGDAARARSGASRADRDASREGSEVGARAAGDEAIARDRHDLSRSDSQAVGVLGVARLRAAAAARHRGRRRHDASGDVSARARPGALERRLRAAVAPAGRRPLRREPEPARSSTTSFR